MVYLEKIEKIEKIESRLAEIQCLLNVMKDDVRDGWERGLCLGCFTAAASAAFNLLSEMLNELDDEEGQQS